MTKHAAVQHNCTKCEKPFLSARIEQYYCPECKREYDRMHRFHKTEQVLRETKITFLPSCAICRNYPAQQVGGVYLCTGCQKGEPWRNSRR